MSCFPFQAMGRIFVGLCQVGAWGCFDEFNRLEERMLSAVSQQVQCIQEALREHSNPNYDKSEASILSSLRLLGSEEGVRCGCLPPLQLEMSEHLLELPAPTECRCEGGPGNLHGSTPSSSQSSPSSEQPFLGEPGVLGLPCSQLSWPHVGPVLLHMALRVSSWSQ